MSLKPPTHIILIIMDTVGAKHCSVYGHGRETTPGLSRIAEEGMLYERCFAPSSWTLPSHASLFSGLYPGEHRVKIEDTIFTGNFYTLPEIMTEMGYYTVGLSSNYFISRPWNFHWGFAEFYDMDTMFNYDRYCQMRLSIKNNRNNYQGTWQEIAFIFKKAFNDKYYQYPLLHLFDRIYRLYWGDCIRKSFFSTQKTFRLAKNIIKKLRDKRIFMFINVMEAHAKYTPPKKYRRLFKDEIEDGNRQELLYEQEIACLDDQIIDFYAFLQAQGLERENLLIISSDHGEAFNEHGHSGHLFTVFNEIIHIPLIVKYPASYRIKGTDSRLVQLHDLFATLLEVVDAPVPSPASSRSLFGPPREVVLVENLDLNPWKVNVKQQEQAKPYMQPCRAVIDRDFFKLIEWYDGRLELYDLNRDFGETRNLLEEPGMAPKVQALQDLLQKNCGPFKRLS